MNVVQCDNLIKSYGQLNALNQLSFELEENKITGLIGRNGAGKTTLLKLIAGYLKPTSGEIQVFSRNPFNNLCVAANIIFVDDNMSFPASFTLGDILTEAAKFYQNWNHDLARGLFDYFSLNPKQRHNRLSKGTKSTFNSIIGLASRCPLTIFDEPTTGMDSAVRKDFYRALLKDYLDYPRTMILSSHLLSEIEDILEDILLIKDGKKCLFLPVLEFKEFAMGLRGNSQAVRRVIEGEKIIYSEEFAPDSLYVVLERKIAQEQLEQAKQAGLEVQTVSTDDLCVYLTAKTKGGIDDVFKRD